MDGVVWTEETGSTQAIDGRSPGPRTTRSHSGGVSHPISSPAPTVRPFSPFWHPPPPAVPGTLPFPTGIAIPRRQISVPPILRRVRTTLPLGFSRPGTAHRPQAGPSPGPARHRPSPRSPRPPPASDRSTPNQNRTKRPRFRAADPRARLSGIHQKGPREPLILIQGVTLPSVSHSSAHRIMGPSRSIRTHSLLARDDERTRSGARA